MAEPMAEGRNVLAAREAWAGEMPDWIGALAAESDRTSQVRAGERLGLSSATVNAALRNRYGASTGRIEQLVRGVLMHATVACPVLGDLATDLCEEWQGKAKAFSDASSLRTRMRRACRACPHSRFTKEDA